MTTATKRSQHRAFSLAMRAGLLDRMAEHREPIDEEIAAESRCDCGHVGLDYRGFRGTGVIFAFSFCPSCGAEREF